MSSLRESHKILFLNTLAFTVSFACWTLNGVLVTFRSAYMIRCGLRVASLSKSTEADAGNNADYQHRNRT